MYEGLTLNKEAKQKWVEALRSGKYKQARGVLVHEPCNGGHSHCCLGVYAEAVASKEPIVHENVWKFVFQIKGKKIRANDILPNDWFKRFFQFDRYRSSTEAPDKFNAVDELQDLLSRKNDNGESFTDIADWIEQNL